MVIANLFCEFFLAVSPDGSIMVDPPSTDSNVGDMVNLTCTTSGGPGNTFTWTFPNGDVIGTTPTISVGVASALDGGMYQCRVENDAGSATETAVINGG